MTLRKAEIDVLQPTLDLSDIFVIIQIRDNHIRDKKPATEIKLYCKNFQELVRESENFKIYFAEYETGSEFIPFRLAGDFKDYFCRSFEECWQFPKRFSDDLGVSVRLWRNDTKQGVCLFHNKGPDEAKRFSTLHKDMAKFPVHGGSPNDGWLLFAVKCSFQAAFPVSYENHIDNWKLGKFWGWRHYNIDDWVRIRYSMNSLEFGLCGWRLNSDEDLVAVLMALEWE